MSTIPTSSIALTPVPDPTPSLQSVRRRRRLSNFHLPSSTRQTGTTPVTRGRLPSLAREPPTSTQQLTTPVSSARPTRHVTIISPSPKLSGKSQLRHSTNASPSEVSITPNRPSSLLRTNDSSTPVRAARRRSSHRAPLNRAQLSAMYASTIKLCQDNKINARNTWTLNLIDYMSMLVGPQSSMTSTQSDVQAHRVLSFEGTLPGAPNSTDTDFQLAGATLDAGVRIYCSRVDSVHNNAFKVLGGLSHTGPGSAEDTLNGTDSGDEAIDTNEAGTGKKRPTTRSGRTTLVSNMALITLNRLETDLMVDPLFQNMSAAFDEGGASGMLVHNLPIGPSGTIVFDSAEPADVLIPNTSGLPVSDSDDLNSDENFVSIDTFPPPPRIDQKDSFNICPKFFQLLRSELRLTEDNSASSQTFNPSQSSSMPSSWPSEENSSTAVSFQYGANDLDTSDSLGVPELDTEQTIDSSNFDEERDEDDVDVLSHANLNTSVGGPGVAKLSAARRGTLDLIEVGLPLDGGEYSFFASTLAAMGWAGPSHWRYRPGLLAGGQALGEKGKEKKQRPRGRTAQLLDFSADAPDEDFAKLFEPGKSRESNQLSHNVRAAMTKDKVTLPVDLHLSPRFLTELFLRSGTSVSLKNEFKGQLQEERGEAEDTPTWQDFDRDGGQDGGDDFEVSGLPLEDDGRDADDVDFDVEDNRGWNEEESTRLSLVQEPQRVQAIDINYAKVAKRVDVRALKTGLWSRLCGKLEDVAVDQTCGGIESDKGDWATDGDGDAVSKHDVRRGDDIRLKDVVNDAHSFVPPEAQDGVSIAYVFICLLHLANEQELRITQANSEAWNGKIHDESGRLLDDLVITSDKAEGEK